MTMAKVLSYSQTGGHDITMIGTLTFGDYVEQVRRFHSYPAPGVVLGGFMVERAKEQITSGTLYNAFSETLSCLPDAIQLLTPCTIGNGWLRVLPLGHFALALYNKETGEGVRVGIDYSKLADFPETHSWLLKLRPKKDQKESLLLEEIRLAGPRVLASRPIRVDVETVRPAKKKGVVLCPSCGEAYPMEYGAICRGCQGKGPYLRWPRNGLFS